MVAGVLASLVLPAVLEATPMYLLIVRERLRPESVPAYGENERAIAAACARLGCPHPYLALVSVADPTDVWWLNAFDSAEERDGVDAAYARNEPLMAALRPLGKRKEDFRRALTTTLAKRRGDGAWRIAGARLFVIDAAPDARGADGHVFESDEGRRFVVSPARDRAAAERLAGEAGAGAMILAVEPRWSLPAPGWTAADPEFWKDSAVARTRR